MDDKREEFGNERYEDMNSEGKPAFSYQGYQVVRREFFAHIQEPAITFNRYQIYVNMACLKKLPTTDYVQILVNPSTKKLVIRPCGEDDKDSFLWRSNGKAGRRPKQITCRVFFAKIMKLMDWNPELRYRLLGKLIHSNEEQLFLFDLTASQTFRRVVLEGEECKSRRIPVLPAEWNAQFGLSVAEHRQALQIDLFHGYTVFGIRIPEPPPPVDAGQETKIDPSDVWMRTYGKGEVYDDL